MYAYMCLCVAASTYLFFSKYAAGSKDLFGMRSIRHFTGENSVTFKHFPPTYSLAMSCLPCVASAAGALLDQERFVAEVPEAQRARILQEFFRWAFETNAPFAFVRHVAWKATRLFKLNVRW